MAQCGENYVFEGETGPVGPRGEAGLPGEPGRPGPKGFEGSGSSGDEVGPVVAAPGPKGRDQHQQEDIFEYHNDKGEVYVIDVADDSTDDDNGCSDSGIYALPIKIDVPIPPHNSLRSDKDGYAFKNGGNLYVYVSYRDISKQDKLIFNFLYDDGSKEIVTDYELVVKDERDNFMIFYIPDMFIDFVKDGPTIVGIDTGGYYRHRAGVVYTKSKVISSFELLGGDNIRIFFPKSFECLGKACADSRIIEITTEYLKTYKPLCEWKETIYPSVTIENLKTSTPWETPIDHPKTNPPNIPDTRKPLYRERSPDGVKQYSAPQM